MVQLQYAGKYHPEPSNGPMGTWAYILASLTCAVQICRFLLEEFFLFFFLMLSKLFSHSQCAISNSPDFGGLYS